MTHTVRRWLVAAALAGAVCGAAPPGRADDAPGPSAAADADTLPPPTPVPAPAPPAYVLPPPTWPMFDFSKPDPLLDRPDAAQPGWYANFQGSFVAMHLRNQLNNPVFNPLTGNTDIVAFPGNRYNPAVMPRVEVGYRLPDNWGSLQLGYSFLVSQGSNPEPFLGGEVAGHFDMNIADITYVSREFSLGPFWEIRWGIGLRALYLYFDANFTALGAPSDVGTILTQRETNHDRAYGPWAFLDLSRRIRSVPGLAVFGRMEGADTYARIKQTAAETLANGAGVEPVVAQVRFDDAVGLNILSGVVGLSYTVPGWNYSRFMAGYQYETFFQIGRIQNSRAQLDIQGLFLRAEFNF